MPVKIVRSRLNRISYLIDILFTLPVLGIGIALGRSFEYVTYDDQRGIALIAQLVSMVLAVIVIVWTIRRLHDVGRRGWFSFFLIPPFIIFLLIYLLVVPHQEAENKWGKHVNTLRIFGIEAKSTWRLMGIMALILLMTFLGTILYGILSSFS